MMNLTQSQIDIFNDIGKKYFINYNISIDVSNGLVVELDAENIIQESVSIKQSINEQSKLAFGGCISSYFSVSVAGANDYAIDGKKMTVTANIEDADENTVYSYSVGEFYIDSSPLSSNKLYRTITAYDCLYTKGNKNASDYYEGLFTNAQSVNLGTFITGLLTYAGIPTNNLNISTNILIYHGVSMQGSEVTVNTLLRMALELLGKYGYIDSDGYFNLIDISSNVSHAIDDYISFDKSEKAYDGVTGVRIQLSSTDEGTLVGQSGNVYDVTSNYLTYGMSSQEITAIGQSLLTTLQSYLFTPCSVETYNTLYLGLGDVISVTDEENVTFYSPILSREINGIVVSKDKLSSNVEHDYNTETYSEANEVKALKGKTLELVKTVDEVSSRMTNIESNTSSAIVQTANTITMNVKRGNDTVSIVLGEVDENNNLVLSAEAKDILLTADNIKIVSDNFNVDTLGNVQIKGSNALLQVRDNETFVDISAGEKLIDVYDSPIIVNSYSTLVDENSFRTFGETKGARIIKVGEYLYTFKQNIVYRASISDIPNLVWEEYRVRDTSDYDVIIQNICEYDGKIVEVGKYIYTEFGTIINVKQYVYADTSLNTTFEVGGNYDTSDIVSFKGNLYAINNFGLWCYNGNYRQFDNIGTVYNLSEQVRVKLKVIDDYLFVISAINGLSVFKQNENSLSRYEPLVPVVYAEQLVLYNTPTIKDIEKIGTNTYVLLAGNSNLFYSNNIEDANFSRCDEIIDGDTSYRSTFSEVNYFDLLVNTGESIIAIGRGLDDCLAMQETCDGELFSSVIDSTDIYDYQDETDSAIIDNNRVITSNYVITFESFSSISQDKENAKNIFSIKKSGEIQYDGEEFNFGKVSDDDVWNAIMKIKKGVLTIPEEPEYSIELETINNTDDITRELKISCYDGIRFSEEENGTETKRFSLTDDYFSCYDVENGKYFNLSNSMLNLKNDDGVGIKLETDTTLNGEDDEGFKIIPSSNSYCGIDVPYVNGYDMHMSLYTHTNQWGVSQFIPSIKVEQRDNTGTLNELYLLDGLGNTGIPNDLLVKGKMLKLKNNSGLGIKLETDTSLNGEDDEGIKIIPSQNCDCGIDAPYVNNYDMHMSLYTHTNQSGASQNIPSIKVEQRDNTGALNELYLLNGDGNTRIPNNLLVLGNENVSGSLDVNLDVTASTFITNSDRKMKNDIANIDEETAIELINSLQPVQYTFKKDENKKLNMGFVAQDVKEVCDNIGIDNFALYDVVEVDKKGNRNKKINLKKGVSDEELSWGLSYTQLIAPMVATIQNLTKRVEELEQKLNDKTSK